MKRALFLCSTLAATPAFAGSDTPWVGDPVNGAKLYKKTCGDRNCHGSKGGGARSGASLVDASRMNVLRDSALFAALEDGSGLKKTQVSIHAFKKKGLSELDRWDIIAHLRTQHMGLEDFFPRSGRYIAKAYAIDKHGIERIERALDKKAKFPEPLVVFTFFNFEGEEGNIQYIPQDPIKLDQLKKDKKAGYLVFVPVDSGDIDGQLGVALDPDGKIIKLEVHGGTEAGKKLNATLEAFEGMGQFNQKEAFKVSDRNAKKIAPDVFAAYLRAMESVTMYIKEERERTWADD